METLHLETGWRCQSRLKVHIFTLTNWYQTSWVLNKLWTFIVNAKFAKYLKDNYIMIILKHAFVILLTVGCFFLSRSYMFIGRMENPWKFVFKIIQTPDLWLALYKTVSYESSMWLYSIFEWCNKILFSEKCLCIESFPFSTCDKSFLSSTVCKFHLKHLLNKFL